MCENQPDLVRSLHQQNQLGDHLDRKYQQGLAVQHRLMQHGQTAQEAYEVAQSTVLAPPDGPATSETPPVPVNHKERRNLLNSLLDQ
jgi:hypothetical protein